MRGSSFPAANRSGAWRRSAVGIVGALIGGLVGEIVLGEEVRFRWDLGPFLLAVAGSVIVLLALEAISVRRR